MRRKRKKRKSRYHRGTHKSPKSSKVINYRSGWELSVCQWLDANPDVLSYEYETIEIPYVSNLRTGKIRRYYPDLLIEFSDGKKILVEIKPIGRLSQAKIQKKIIAGKKWCEDNGITFEIWSEDKIKEVKLLLEKA